MLALSGSEESEINGLAIQSSVRLKVSKLSKLKYANIVIATITTSAKTRRDSLDNKLINLLKLEKFNKLKKTTHRGMAKIPVLPDKKIETTRILITKIQNATLLKLFAREKKKQEIKSPIA
ncbi:hypothetical protein MASR1M12_40800 [Erysipelotrichia bacterium]